MKINWLKVLQGTTLVGSLALGVANKVIARAELKEEVAKYMADTLTNQK